MVLILCWYSAGGTNDNTAEDDPEDEDEAEVEDANAEPLEVAKVMVAPNDGDSIVGVGVPADGGSKRNALPPPLLPRNADDGIVEAPAPEATGAVEA